MKVAKLLVALSGTLVLVAILVLPQIIEARRARAAGTPSNVVQGQSNVTVGTQRHFENLRATEQLPVVRRANASQWHPVPYQTQRRRRSVVQNGGSDW